MSSLSHIVDHPDDNPSTAFQLIEKLGEGSYGRVFSALDVRDNTMVAIKMMPMDGDAQTAEFRKEIDILRKCRDANIVSYRGSYFKEGNIWIVMEHCGGGSLADLQAVCGITLMEEEIAEVVACALLGLKYLHSAHLIHRDIKAGNILLSEDGSAKLADFGVSAQLGSTMSKRRTVIGTPYWMSPEVIQEMTYDNRADIWSLGITCIELADGMPPYANIHPMRAIFMIPSREPPTVQDPDSWSSEFLDFVSACLRKDPRNRPSAEALLLHPFVRAAGVRIASSGGCSPLLEELVTKCLPLLQHSRREEAAATASAAAVAAAAASSGMGTVANSASASAAAAAVGSSNSSGTFATGTVLRSQPGMGRVAGTVLLQSVPSFHAMLPQTALPATIVSTASRGSGGADARPKESTSSSSTSASASSASLLPFTQNIATDTLNPFPLSESATPKGSIPNETFNPFPLLKNAPSKAPTGGVEWSTIRETNPAVGTSSSSSSSSTIRSLATSSSATDEEDVPEFVKRARSQNQQKQSPGLNPRAVGESASSASSASFNTSSGGLSNSASSPTAALTATPDKQLYNIDSAALDRLSQEQLRERLDALDEHFRKDVAMLSELYERAREAIETKLSSSEEPR